MTHGSRSRYRYEGNRVLFHLFNEDTDRFLSSYRTGLQNAVNRVEYSALTSDEQLAFWLNLHNVVVIDEIAKRYPISSPQRIRMREYNNGSLFEAKLVAVNGVSLSLNDIGRVEIKSHDPMVFDSYRQNRHTGSFILVDRMTHETVAAGMFVDAGNDDRQSDHWSSQTLATFSAQPVYSRVPSERRSDIYGHPPRTILVSGLSGSGKTTLAGKLELALFERGRKTVLLDGQTMRAGLSRDLGFSVEERSENLRRAAEVARLLNDSGLVCVCAFIAPHRDVREKVRRLIGPGKFFHVHLSTPVEICRERDTSGIYAAADRGEVAGIAGVDRDYETPENADVVIPMQSTTVDEAVKLVMEQLIRTE